VNRLSKNVTVKMQTLQPMLLSENRLLLNVTSILHDTKWLLSNEIISLYQQCTLARFILHNVLTVEQKPYFLKYRYQKMGIKNHFSFSFNILYKMKRRVIYQELVIQVF